MDPLPTGDDAVIAVANAPVNVSLFGNVESPSLSVTVYVSVGFESPYVLDLSTPLTVIGRVVTISVPVFA